jgi:hypothetical protein
MGALIMPIDPKMVKWDAPESSGIDPRMVKWEDAAPESSGIGPMVGMADKALDFAYRITPLGMLQTANEKGNEYVRKGTDYLADKTMDATNSPALATLVKMSPDLAGLAAGKFISGRMPAVVSGSKASNAAARVGVNPTWGQRTNSPALMQMEDTLRRMPGSGWVMGANDARNQSGINTAAAKSIGEKADRVTGELLANAEARLGSERDVLRESVNIPKGDKGVISAINKAAMNLKKSLRGNGAFNSDMERVKHGISSNSINGEQYQIWRTDLRGAMDTAYKGGKAKLGDAYKEVVNALDDAARGSEGEAWKANDKAFSTMDILQKGNVVNPETGNVSAPLLTNAFFQKFGKTAKQGKMPGPIADIASAQKAYPRWAEGSPTGKVDQYTSLVPWALSPVTTPIAAMMTSNPYNMLRYAPYAASTANALTDDLRSLGLLYDTQQ